MPFPLFVVAKRAGQSLVATCITGPTRPRRLFYVHDSHRNTRFLVDTGAEVSVVPPTRAERSQPQGIFTLQPVDGAQIATFSVRSCILHIGLRRTFRWVFVIANVKQAILGADFLHHFGLIVDIRFITHYTICLITELTVEHHYLTIKCKQLFTCCSIIRSMQLCILSGLSFVYCFFYEILKYDVQCLFLQYRLSCLSKVATDNKHSSK